MKNLILLISFCLSSLIYLPAQHAPPLVDMFFINTDTGIERASAYLSDRKILIPASMTTAQGIAIDHESGRVYWSDWVNKKIESADFFGSQIQVVLDTGLNLPEGIALDIKEKKIYWVDSGNNKVQRANFDGTNVEDLYAYQNVNLDAIALDTKNGKIYWTDWGAGAAVGRVLRADLDGSNFEVLVTIHNAIIKGIALDIDKGKIYWTDCGFDKIQSSDLDGNQIEDLVDTGLTTPNAIALSFCKGAGSACWTTAIEDKFVPDIHLFPNPTKHLLHVTNLEIGDKLAIYDLYGHLLYQQKVSQEQLHLNVSTYPKGYYQLQLKRKNRQAVNFPFVRN